MKLSDIKTLRTTYNNFVGMDFEETAAILLRDHMRQACEEEQILLDEPMLELIIKSFQEGLDDEQIEVMTADGLGMSQRWQAYGSFVYKELSASQVKTFAAGDYTVEQMDELATAYYDGLTKEQIAVLRDPALSPEQMGVLRKAFEDDNLDDPEFCFDYGRDPIGPGLSVEQARSVAATLLPAEQMQELVNKFREENK